MVKKQLGGIMEDTDSGSAIKEMQKGLDENSDGKVSFQEYLTLVGYLATSLSQHSSSAQNVFAQPRECLYPGECHAATDPDLP
ncbi:hypothetical protein Q5P01_011256 [Channa striata]|uniref:EF-hand domain-containing protein n=1 Tax=Channa striata TaxID=64152 RepID=A0AA88MX73_CHASR|nr:hypothetical protein Q5P01_011256 [Channa striata]